MLDDENKLQSNQQDSKSRFSILESLKSLTGNKTLDEKTLEPTLDMLQKELQSRNVANDVAGQIIRNLKVLLMNKKTDSFSTV